MVNLRTFRENIAYNTLPYNFIRMLLLPHKGGLDERGDVPVRQFDLEPFASIIQSDPHGSTVLQPSVISIECRNLTGPGCQNPVIVSRVMRA